MKVLTWLVNHFTSFVPFFALLDTFALFVAVTIFFVTVLLHVLGQSNVYLSYAFFWPVVLVLHTYYGSTDCWVFKWGVQNYKDFRLRINIPPRKFIIKIRTNFWELATTPILKIQSFSLGWYFSKNLCNFVPPAWKLNNPYYHKYILYYVICFNDKWDCC